MVSAINQFQWGKSIIKEDFIWNHPYKITFSKPIFTRPSFDGRLSYKVNSIFGQVYDCDFNRLRLKRFSLISKGLRETVIKVDGSNGIQYITIRTDGMYRLLQNPGVYSHFFHQVGIRGRWVSPHIFSLDCFVVGQPQKFYITLFFIGKELLVSIREEAKQWNRLWVKGRVKTNS